MKHTRKNRTGLAPLTFDHETIWPIWHNIYLGKSLAFYISLPWPAKKNTCKKASLLSAVGNVWRSKNLLVKSRIFKPSDCSTRASYANLLLLARSALALCKEPAPPLKEPPKNTTSTGRCHSGRAMRTMEGCASIIRHRGFEWWCCIARWFQCWVDDWWFINPTIVPTKVGIVFILTFYPYFFWHIHIWCGIYAKFLKNPTILQRSEQVMLAMSGSSGVCWWNLMGTWPWTMPGRIAGLSLNLRNVIIIKQGVILGVVLNKIIVTKCNKT